MYLPQMHVLKGLVIKQLLVDDPFVLSSISQKCYIDSAAGCTYKVPWIAPDSNCLYKWDSICTQEWLS